MKQTLIILIVLTHSIMVLSQDSIIDQRFKSLQINSSPAYVILGVDPENIRRPNSPIDFAANIQSAVVNQKLQPNFALVTSPYYWSKYKKDDKKFNILNYIGSDDYWQNVAKSITFSFATSPSDSFTFGKLKQGTGFGFGLNIQLAHGSLSKKTTANLSEYFFNSRLYTILNQLVDKLEGDDDAVVDVEEFIEDVVEKNGSLKDLPDVIKKTSLPGSKKKLAKSEFKASDKTSIVKMRDKVDKNSALALAKVNTQQFPLTREGFMLELAIANAGIAENSEWSKRTNAKTAIWLTPSYRFNVNKEATDVDLIDVMAVLRLTLNSKEVDTCSYFDAGAKLQWIHNRFSIAAEGIFRYLSKKPQNLTKSYTYRTGVTLTYKVNDFITFTSTIGNNFDGNSIQYDKPKTVFAVGGFNFGFSNLLKQITSPIK